MVSNMGEVTKKRKTFVVVAVLAAAIIIGVAILAASGNIDTILGTNSVDEPNAELWAYEIPQQMTGVMLGTTVSEDGSTITYSNGWVTPNLLMRHGLEFAPVDDHKTINRYIDAINEKDVEDILSFLPVDDKQKWVDYFNDEAQSYIGIKNIKSAEVIEIVDLSVEQLEAGGVDNKSYEALYGDTVDGYLVKTDIEVFSKKGDFNKGANYILVMVAEKDWKRKIVAFEEASEQLIEQCDL